MSVKLLTEHLLEVLSLKGGCTGSSDPTPVKMSNCWKSHAAAHLPFIFFFQTECMQSINEADVCGQYVELIIKQKMIIEIYHDMISL